MAKSTKHDTKQRAGNSDSQPKENESSQHDRAPYQKNTDRDPVKSAEQTRHIPTKHGAIH
jgi:hypothetical protein